ncbi:glycosyltransferase family 1 protein [Halobacillus sp. A5]|uniref:glycosyltransferase family 1 protein n=1 Tax=Halobacillus sp. A5 TaxID=2880263 RepID=UPI0020A6913B|nr:glycosyltransferase family 1 protein [Halobacillus sp. A5]MCP3029203.1 glycosyltransferase family 1 protein [Halobacillus sp. A5]
MGSPLRVLHAVVNMNRGGAETLLMNLYRNIDRSKVQFDFLTCKPGVFDQEIENLGGTVHRIPYVTDVGHRGYKKALKRFFQSHQYKIVHAHMDKMSGIVLQEAEKAKVPVRIAHSHNTQSEGGMLTKLYKNYAASSIHRSATHRFACSRSAAEWLFGRKSSQVHLLKNGIDCRRFLYSAEKRLRVREQLNLSPETFVAGHVGRFNYQKNHNHILEIFCRFLNTHENSVLLLAGDGTLRNTIEAKSKQLGIEDKVKFLGVREDVDELLQAFDLFLFPSLHEGLPVTLIEAQNAGLPCLITDTITKEVDMGMGLVEHLPLSHIDPWITAMKKAAATPDSRVVDTALLKRNGYDIKQSAVQTQNNYIVLGRVVS